MGKNMVLRLLEQKIEVVAWNRSPEPVGEVAAAGAIGAASISELVGHLTVPRIIWVMLPAGQVTDEILNELLTSLSAGDTIIDGGNAYFPDSVRHFAQCQNKGVGFVDVGVSGGPDGARNGACLLVGGQAEHITPLTPLLDAASLNKSWAHLGKPGSGHFAKMVHNGIEYGMMQAIADGAAVLKYSDMDFDMTRVFEMYNNGSVIQSRLVGWAAEALREDEDLNDISSTVGMLGEGEWTVKTAKEAKITIPTIEAAVVVRQQSAQIDPNSPEGYRNKMVSALREKFGKHNVRIDKTTAKE